MTRTLLTVAAALALVLPSVASAQLISEFEPNPFGVDPDPVSVELSGTPGASFSGEILSLESDSGTIGTVDRLASVSGTFDSNGLLVVSIPDLENPSFTVVLTTGATVMLNDDLDANDDGILDDVSGLGTILDAVGIPDNTTDEAFIYANQLGGIDFVYTGSEPRLVFRSASTGDWYAVNGPDNGEVQDAFGNTFAPSDFDADPTAGFDTFGAINPAFLSAASVTTSATVGWRLLSSPITQTVDALAQINLVSGAGGYVNGTNCQVNAITNLFTGYLGDETANPNGGYVAPGEGAVIEPGAGFFWYFFGDMPAAGQPTACDDASMNTSTTQALPLVLNADGTGGASLGNPTVTIPGTDDADGFYMLGNPYSAAYDVSAITATQAGTSTAVPLQAGVQLWDPEIGDYVVYTADGTGDVSDADNDDVSIWQGFFVERSGADPGTDVTFNFGGSGIQDGVEGDGFVARQAAGAPLLSFQVTDGTRTGAAAVVRFEAGADAAWDRFDLSKLAPFTADFAQIGPVGQDRDGALVTKAVESLAADLNGSVDIPVSFLTSETEGTFTVRWAQSTLAPDWTATLTDLVTNESTDLYAATEYTFEHSASAPAERFVLTVAASVVTNEDGAQAFALTALAPNPTAGTARMTLTVEASEAVTVQVYDALGRLVATVFDDVVTAGAPRAIGVPTAGLSAGVYVVRVQGASFAEARRLTVTR